MTRLKRVLIAACVALVCVPALCWIASEVAAVYEMHTTGMHSRAELGDDLGFGILLFLFVPPATLVGVVIVWCITWWVTGRWSLPARSAKNIAR